jgi:hypothetical protein
VVCGWGGEFWWVAGGWGWGRGGWGVNGLVGLPELRGLGYSWIWDSAGPIGAHILCAPCWAAFLP